MAICNIIDDPDRSAEEHELIQAHVRGSGPTPPDSLSSHHHRLGLA